MRSNAIKFSIFLNEILRHNLIKMAAEICHGNFEIYVKNKTHLKKKIYRYGILVYESMIVLILAKN